MTVAPGKRSAARGDGGSIIKPRQGRQASLSPFQGLSVCQPDPGLRFACPGLLSFGPPGRLRKNPIWTRLNLNGIARHAGRALFSFWKAAVSRVVR
jgi:hypothetical protein